MAIPARRALLNADESDGLRLRGRPVLI
jgi:hypothetical protein